MASLIRAFVCILLVSSLHSCGTEPPADFSPQACPSGDLKARNLLLGNPTNAVASTDSPNNYLLEMDEYTISYSRDRGIPNWVSWHLSASWYEGSGDRQDNFRANPYLPSDWSSPDQNSYDGSGFDRGHNCPSADRLCSDNFNSATFFMTNMIPQAPLQNQGAWKVWECYFRYLAGKGNELYIVMGNYGVGGDGWIGYKEYIEDESENVTITVPESVWKVAVVLPEGDDGDLNAIDRNTVVIAIDIPNSQQTADFDWNDTRFMTTVDAIEERMGQGFDLLSNLPVDVQAALENRVYNVDPGFYPCG